MPSLLSPGHGPAFGDDEDDLSVRLILAHDLVAGFPDEIWNIDGGERVGAAHLQLLANRHALERLAGFQGGQRAFEPGEIKQCHSHGLNMTKESVQVNQL